jgi:hypothetical protein
MPLSETTPDSDLLSCLRYYRLSYQLLILNGHRSHLTKAFIEYCNQNRILLVIYSPHLTYTLQPLDVVIFKPLSSAYSGLVAAFMERC